MKRLSDQIIDRINKDFSRINILLNRYLKKLEDLQDSLGQIHDCDAILSFFEKLENYPETKPSYE